MEFDINKPAKIFLADCVNNLSKLLSVGEEPTMDISLYGVTFEFRIKPYQIIKSNEGEQNESR